MDNALFGRLGCCGAVEGLILATLRACFLNGKTDTFGSVCTAAALGLLFVQLGS